LEGELHAHAATITVVGQVKAGKTSLISVLAGHPGFLPSDVNPWTSVVTTVHVNKPAPRGTLKASFQFFERDEWERLMRGGGRLGEMARRAGASEEMARIEEQLLSVRRRSQERLGRNFELLLGQTHNYDRADTHLIERYVCMGDPETYEQEAARQGRFADITRAADIYLRIPDYPVAFSLQDTPGVNDPFLMREQITLRCVRNSELCVMVLSAAQALNTVDLALIRLLSTLDRRQLIIFVNRIDELDRPSEQVPEIRAFLDATLARHGVGSVTHIVFGSARWAEAALSGRPRDLPEAAQAALRDWVRAAEVPPDPDLARAVWRLSGLPTLVQAIGDRVSEGSSQRLMQKIRSDLRNVVTQSFAGFLGEADGANGAERVHLSEAQVQARLTALSQEIEADLRQETGQLLSELGGRLNAAADQFTESTVAAMIRHIEVYGIEGQWECDPMRLRVQLRAAYMQFACAIRAAGQRVLARAAQDLGALYRDLLGDAARNLGLEPPMVPPIPAPVAIGRTIVVDLQGGWWKRWLKLRRGAQAFAGEYRALILSEAAAVVAEIEDSQAAQVDAALRQALRDFLEEHGQTLLGIARAGRVSGPGLRTTTGTDRHLALRRQLEAAAALLDAEPRLTATA
jgi:signal recognition particle receptor subunit beta